MNERIRILGGLLLGLALNLPAAFGQESVFETEIDNLTATTLENGLEVVVIEDHSLPLVTIEISVHNGSFTETDAYNGLSHLYEHMFFKGNQSIPTQEAYLARQRELGMRWNGSTSEERVNYYFTLSSDRLCEGLVFMSDAIRTPLFQQEELERERQVVLSEFDRSEANPYFHLQRAVSEALWYAYPSRKDVIGDRRVIAGASREQMFEIQRRYYIPNNSALFLAGDVTVQEGLELAQQIFGGWERQPDPFLEDPPVIHPPLQEPVARLVEQDVQVVTLLVSWHGPDVTRDLQATFAADVFSFIVTQPGHRFQHNLVDSGLTLFSDLSYYTQANVGPISLSAQLTAPNLEPGLQAIREEIRHFTDPDYFTDEQLQTAKTLLAVSELYSRQQTASWVHVVSFWWAVAGLDYYRDYVRSLQAVSREDIEHYIRTYIQDRPFVIGVLVNPSTRRSLDLTPERTLAWFGDQEQEPAESGSTDGPTERGVPLR